MTKFEKKLLIYGILFVIAYSIFMFIRHPIVLENPLYIFITIFCGITISVCICGTVLSSKNRKTGN